MESERYCPLVMLASGQSIRMQRVMLYEEDHVKEIALLRAQAMKSLGGVSTGVGFLGSPEWALGGAAALGLIEGMLSSAMRKQASEALTLMEYKADNLSRAGVLFEVNKITGLGLPHPHRWSATHSATRKRHVHAGDDFVHFEADLGLISVRWSHIVAYVPPTASTQATRVPPAQSTRVTSEGAVLSGIDLPTLQKSVGDQVYKGIRYNLLPDLRIEVSIEGQSHYWRSLHVFRGEVDALLNSSWGKPPK